MNQFTLTCLWCEKSFISRYETTLYCCTSHKEQARELRKRKRNPNYRPHIEHIKQCLGCGKTFTTTNSKKTYCETECREWFTEQRKRTRDAQYINQKTPAFRRRIYFQSEGKCGICKEIIDLSFKHPHPLSYSIDHVIPRSKNGKHTSDNLQASHLLCNMQKGNK